METRLDGEVAASTLSYELARIIDPQAWAVVFDDKAPENRDVMAAVDRLRVARLKAAEILVLLSTPPTPDTRKGE